MLGSGLRLVPGAKFVPFLADVAAMNTRSILSDRSLEVTTSAALMVNCLSRAGFGGKLIHRI
jgi:hypothetical protein